MQEFFKDIVEEIKKLLVGDEKFICSFEGEVSDFCRFNTGKIRQSGEVVQNFLQLNLINGRRHLCESISLSTKLKEDKKILKAAIQNMRSLINQIPDDPYLLLNEEVENSIHCRENLLISREDIVSEILEKIEPFDFVGIYASGTLFRGFANSFGQFNWYESSNFNFDWSLYASGDKAVKQGYAGFEWHPQEFEEKLKQGKGQLDIVKRAPKTIDPGKYRVYLSPSALEEVTGILSWGGFGLKSRITKNSPLMKLHDGKASFNSKVKLYENINDGLAPNFDKAGFIKPDNILLVEDGASKDSLVSARSAKEYGVPTTGSNVGEAPEALWMEAGDLPNHKVLEELDTGLYINNLWYMNFSDRMAGRVTGMTRFASFWVENGEIVAPLNVMRFDESVYSLLGDNLEALTQDRELIISNSTYDQRSTGSVCLPGAIIRDMNFTL